jgi:hypothetical protein
MLPYCILTLTRRPGGSSVPLTYRSRRSAGPPATSSCQTTELRFSRGVQTEALDASCGPRPRTWHPGPPPPPAFIDAPHGRRTSSPDYQYCQNPRAAKRVHPHRTAHAPPPVPSVLALASACDTLSSAAAGSTGHQMGAAAATEIGGFAAAPALRPAPPAAAVAAPLQRRRAVAARALRTATSEKAADLATATNGVLPAVVSEVPATAFGCFVPTRLVSLSFAAAVLVGLTVALSFAPLFIAGKSDPRLRICRW